MAIIEFVAKGAVRFEIPKEVSEVVTQALVAAGYEGTRGEHFGPAAQTKKKGGPRPLNKNGGPAKLLAWVSTQIRAVAASEVVLTLGGDVNKMRKSLSYLKGIGYLVDFKREGTGETVYCTPALYTKLQAEQDS